MTVAPSDWGILFRVLAATSFVAVLGGLPIAVEFAGSSERLSHASASSAFGATSILISTPVRISDRFPLTIDSGRVTGIERTQGGERRDPASIAIDEASLTLNLSEHREPSAIAAPVPEARSPVAPQIAGFLSGVLRLTRARLAVVGPNGANAEVKDISATVTVTRKGSYKLVGTGSISGQRIAIDALWSDASAREGTPQVPLKLNIRSAMLEATLDGLFKTDDRPSFSGQAEFRLPHFRRFMAWLALGRGVSEQLKSISVAGALEWSPGQMSFTRANLGVDGHQATGAMTIKHSGGRLSVDGTLGFQELDLGRQLQGLMAGFPSQASEPHVLTVIDADLRLSAAKVQAPGIEMGRAAVAIALNKGRLQADIAELEIESGVAGGQLSVDLNEASPKAGLKLKLRGVDFGRVLAEPMRRNPILGKANLTFEGTLGGRTLNEGLASLAGRGHFELAEPGRLGLDLPALIHAAKASGVVGWSAAGRGGTFIDALNGRFRVLNGALTIESVQARSGATVLSGSGRLDVPARLMDMVVACGGAGEPAGASDVLLLRGTWEAPSISLQRQAVPELKVEAPVDIH
jgi:hypothetical protein